MNQDKTFEAKTFGRFASVGVLNTLIDLGLFNGLLFLGVGNYLAASISFLGAVANSYVWNRSWTFAHIEKRSIAPQFALFLVSNLVGLAINTALQYAITRAVGDQPSIIMANLGKIIAITLVVIWNYSSSRYLIFRPIEDRPKRA